MKIFLRRVPFFTQQLLGWAYLVFWVLKIVSPEIQVQLSHLPRLVYDLLLFVTLNAFIQVLSALRRRKKATQFLSTLPTQFYETVHTLSAMPIAYLSSAKSRRNMAAFQSTSGIGQTEESFRKPGKQVRNYPIPFPKT